MACTVSDLLTAMEEHGIRREALGPGDLRDIFGLISDPEENVRQVVGELRKSPMVPEITAIHGMIIDVNTGRICFVDTDQRRRSLPSGGSVG